MIRSPVDQLKVWLDNTPFKSNNTKLKRETLFAIMNSLMALKQDDIDKLCGPGGKLDDKLAFTLGKYIFEAYKLIQAKDQRK